MALQAWWVFVCAAFLVSAMPGPNMLHVMTRAMQFGIGRAFFTMAGCMAGLLLLFGLSAMGMGALLAALPRLFSAIKIAGACYLFYLGIKAWREDDGVQPDLASDGSVPQAATGWTLLRGGFLISISNPKALIFAAAFFPQFVNPEAAKGPQFAVLLLTFVVIECGWYMTYALGGRSLVHHLRKAGWRRMLNRITGCLFMGFGASLLAWRQ